MSDKTNAATPQPSADKELPDKPGCWFQLFDNGIIEERWVVFGDNGYWCYFSTGQGEHGVACACQAGKWVKAIGPLEARGVWIEGDGQPLPEGYYGEYKPDGTIFGLRWHPGITRPGYRYFRLPDKEGT